MPKAMQYNKGSIIYFENDRDERIFILQKGVVILTTTDEESGGTETQQLSNGEFFGVKSALGHFPREETATVLQDAVAISMTVQEFENIFSNNKQVVYKMLRVFSGQLRQVHKKTQALLQNDDDSNQQGGMFAVAKSFFNDQNYRACCDVCIKYLTHFPTAYDKDQVAKLYADAKLRHEKLSSKRPQAASAPVNSAGALKQFMLPAFERFQKKYEPDQVIICEFEPGDSFYLIQSGEVQLVKCVNGVKKNLDILKPGEFFGEMAILDNSPRSATCMAIGQVECLEFNKANFEVLVTGNPQIAIVLLKLFCKRIYDQKRRLKILTIKDPTARIADTFCMFDEMNPSLKAGEKSRRFNITQADITSWSGLPSAVVQEEMHKFTSGGKVQVFDNYMIVTNINDMRRTVEFKSVQRK